MIMGEKIFVVIAAYNEDSVIDKVIKDLRKNGYKNIVVVDDGSSDKTFEVVAKQGVNVLKHAINRGQGAALKTGIDFALAKGADIVVTGNLLHNKEGMNSMKKIARAIKMQKRKRSMPFS